MASMLTPSLDTPSTLALPTNMANIQQGALAQNIDNQAFPTAPPPMKTGGIAHLAAGGAPNAVQYMTSPFFSSGLGEVGISLPSPPPAPPVDLTPPFSPSTTAYLQNAGIIEGGPFYASPKSAPTVPNSSSANFSPSTTAYLQSIDSIKAPHLAAGGRPSHGEVYRSIIAHFARGGLSNPAADDLLRHHLIGGRAAIEQEVSNDPHIQQMFGIAPPASPVASPTPAVAPRVASPVPSDPYAQYDSSQGRAYLADRAAMTAPVHIHDVVNPTPTVEHFAEGGQVGLLHKFKKPVPDNKYIPTPHYRQTFTNPVLTKVRTEMRVR